MPLEKLVPTKTARLSVLAAGRPLHSLYDPLREAEKFVRGLALSGRHRYYILLECALGYIIPLLRESAPQTKIISLHVSDFYVQHAPAGAGADAVWSPASGDVFRFLERVIPDTEAAGIKIIEWRPALAAYGEQYARLLNAACTFIKRVDANKRTLAEFGRLWFANTLKNTARIHSTALPAAPAAGPCIVAGAGPHLERDLAAIRAAAPPAGNALVIAAASALPPLLAGGVQPDVVVSTDGGFWAGVHLYQYARAFPAGAVSLPPPLAFSLNAALPSALAGHPLFPLAFGLHQSLLLRAAGAPFLPLPSRGTVSATAVDIALGISRGAVYTSGVDFAVDDIKTHAAGYYFDALASARAGRFAPEYAARFERSRAVRAGGSLGVYERWFAAFRTDHAGRLVQFAESAYACKPAPATRQPPLVWQYARPRAVLSPLACVQVLARAMHDGGAGYGDALRQELSELLFAGDGEKDCADVCQAAREAARKIEEKGGRHG
ncbi:MAG: DUF115 domain-containing protein [Spirochaetaceae bacterium]|jgi:hypothetical protein|nr:DUF115 domain-containing protein [Spirochaetaceae bacterium]